MAERRRVVHVGCGGISRAWLNLEWLPERVEIVGFCDLNEEAAAARRDGSPWPEAAVGTDLDAMLAELAPEIVFDCTVPGAHRVVTETALRHGCHVLGEKPMADTLENGLAMVAAARAAGRIYAVTQTRRYNPNMRRAKAFLDSGVLGPIHTVESQFFIGAHFGGFRAALRHVLVLDMAIHTFDQARMLTGANPERVYCEEWNPPHSWYDQDASAMALFTMTGGLRYLYHGSWCAEGGQTSWESNWRFVGTKGTLLWDGADGFHAEIATPAEETLIWPREEAPVPEVPPLETLAGGRNHAGALGDFLECLDAGIAPPTVCTDNIHSLAMVDGAVRSSEAGAPVSIQVDQG